MQVAAVKENSGTSVLTGVSASEAIDIALIRADQRAQPREHLNTAITEAYAEDMAAGAVFPPLIVFYDGSSYWLADGFHRRYAAISLGLAEFQCEVRSGELRDAILFSCAVNAAHGVPRTNDDKRRAVTKLLEDEEWSHWSDREIARRAKVNHDLVGRLRATIKVAIDGSSDKSGARTFKTKHGTVAKMNTAAIGHNAPAAKPETNRPAGRIADIETARPQHAARPSPGRGAAAICERVREAITILSGLPPAHEVAGYFAGTDAAIIISERLRPAAAWLADFSDAWKDD
jgi:hypothetical protein